MNIFTLKFACLYIFEGCCVENIHMIVKIEFKTFLKKCKLKRVHSQKRLRNTITTVYSNNFKSFLII